MMDGVAKNNQSPIVGIGTVVAPPPNLQVSYNGIILENDELVIDERWLTEHYRTRKGHIVSATQNRAGGSGDPAFESHNHDIDNDYTYTSYTTNTLEIGDKVLIMPFQDSKYENQQYAVITRMVRPDRRPW